MQEEEDESLPLGSGFVYEDETLHELMNDVLGTRRVEVGLIKASMLGETVNVNGQVWKVRGDIKKQDIGLEENESDFEDFLEIRLRCGNAEFESLPKRFRSNYEVRAGNRASPRLKPARKEVPEESKQVHHFS